jgi:hypothetical protein
MVGNGSMLFSTNRPIATVSQIQGDRVKANNFNAAKYFGALSVDTAMEPDRNYPWMKDWSRSGTVVMSAADLYLNDHDRKAKYATQFPGGISRDIGSLYQGSLIMTHRDRVGGPSGRREAAGDAVHRQGFPTPSDGSHMRPARRLTKAFGRCRARFAMSRIAAAHAPSGLRLTEDSNGDSQAQRDHDIHCCPLPPRLSIQKTPSPPSNEGTKR